MDPISNGGRLAALLRQRLLERSASTAGSRQSREARGTPAQARSQVRAAGSIQGLDDRRLRRAVVENILSDQFGDGLVNDAKFQQVVDQVTAAIESDEGGAGLLATILDELRSGRR
jgi:hypothetical protein